MLVKEEVIVCELVMLKVMEASTLYISVQQMAVNGNGMLVVLQSLVGVVGDLVFIHRVYHIITHLFMWMHAIHIMQYLFKGSRKWPKI